MTQNGSLANTHTVNESDFILVSKFSKYDAHILACNTNFIVYTSSKSSMVRVISQDGKTHFPLDTGVGDTITHLALYQGTSPSTSILVTGSKNSSVYTFWTLTLDAGKIPAVLIFKLTDIPSSATYEVVRNSRLCAFFTDGNQLDCVPIDEYSANITESEGSSERFTTKRARTYQYKMLSKVAIYSMPWDIYIFTVSEPLGLLVYVLKSAPKNTLVYFVKHSMPSNASGLPIKIQPNDILYSYSIRKVCFLKFLKLRVNSILEDYLLIASDNASILHFLHLKTRSISTFEVRPYISSTQKNTITYDSSLNIILISSGTRSTHILVDTGINSTPEKIQFVVSRVDLPLSIEVLDCQILASIESENEKKKQQVIDLYVYHTKGISIAPITVRNSSRPSSGKSNSPTSSNTNSMETFSKPQTKSSNAAEGGKSDSTLYQDLITDCVNRYQLNSNHASDKFVETLQDFLVKSDFVEIITQIVTENVLKRLPKESLDELSKLKTLSLSPKTQDTSVTSRPDYKKEESENVSANSDANDQSMLISHGLFDSLEKASRSEPGAFSPPQNDKQDSAFFASHQQAQVQPSFFTSHSGHNSVPSLFDLKSSNGEPSMPMGNEPTMNRNGDYHMAQRHASSPLIKYNHQEHMTGNSPLGFTSFTQENIKAPLHRSIATSPPNTLPSTSLGNSPYTLGKPYSQIWGTPLSNPSPINMNDSKSITNEARVPNANRQDYPYGLSQQLSSATPIRQNSSVSPDPIQQLNLSSFNNSTSSNINLETSSFRVEQEPALQVPLQKSYFIFIKPSKVQLSNKENQVVDQLANKKPMVAFHMIRSSPLKKDQDLLPSEERITADLAQILTYSIFLDSKKESSDDIVSYDRSEVIKWITKIFEKNFLLILGYIAYLVSPVLTNDEDYKGLTAGETGHKNLSQVKLVAMRIKWAYSFLTYVNKLVNRNSTEAEYNDQQGGDSSNDDSDVSFDEELKKQWDGNREILSQTLNRIGQDATNIINSYKMDSGAQQTNNESMGIEDIQKYTKTFLKIVDGLKQM